MSLRTHHKLFLSYSLLVAAVVVALSLGVEAALRRPLLEQAGEELQRELALGRELFDLDGSADPEGFTRRLGRLTGHRVTIIDIDGDVLGDSEVERSHLPELENHAGREEVREALATGRGVATRRSASVDAELLYAAMPTARGPIIRFAVGIEQIDAAVARVRRQILQVGGVALLLAAILSFGFSVAVTRPLRRMRGIAAAMTEGDLDARVALSRSDELGELGLALDSLAGELQRRLGQLEGEREEMTALIDAMAEGVLAIGADGALRRANPAARMIFSLPEGVEGLAPESVARRRPFSDLVRRVLAGERVSPTELEYRGRHLLATAQPLPRGGAVLVFLDTSELHRLEGIRRDFVANASHELKTPLTVIRGHAETLLDEDLPPPMRREFAGIVQANADRLQTILDDLLDLSRIESGGWEVSPESLRLVDVVDHVWQVFAPAAEERRIVLDCAIDAEAEGVEADRGGLEQILTNLFSNALRYTPDAGRIEIGARRREPGWVEIEVRDSGSGIPEPHLERIFERFYRVDPARSRAEGGTGLGLAIVRHLVERHGGAVAAESELGEGTTVRFTLPAAR